MRFHQSSYSVNEDNRSVQPVLVLSSPATTNITVTVASIDISAKGKNTVIMLTHNIAIYRANCKILSMHVIINMHKVHKTVKYVATFHM